jgi:hypothetical protein
MDIIKKMECEVINLPETLQLQIVVLMEECGIMVLHPKYLLCRHLWFQQVCHRQTKTHIYEHVGLICCMLQKICDTSRDPTTR